MLFQTIAKSIGGIVSVLIQWLGQRGLGQTLVGCAIGTTLSLITINLHEKYLQKHKERISATHEIAKKQLVDPQIAEKKEKLGREVIMPLGGFTYPNDLPYRVKKDMEIGNFVDCPPDEIFKSKLYITRINDPLACEVLKEKLKAREDVFNYAVDLFLKDHDSYRAAQAQNMLDEIRSAMHQSKVFECITCPSKIYNTEQKLSSTDEKTNELIKSRLPRELKVSNKEKIKKHYIFTAEGHYPGKIKFCGADTDMKLHNYTECPPITGFNHKLYITGYNNLPPSVCDVLREQILGGDDPLSNVHKDFMDTPRAPNVYKAHRFVFEDSGS